MLMQDKILFIWLWPIPAWSEPRQALVLISYAFGPRLPDVCCFEVSALFKWPQNEHLILNELARPCLCSSHRVKGKGPKWCEVILQLYTKSFTSNCWIAYELIY
jgi:hypothetical protein